MTAKISSPTPDGNNAATPDATEPAPPNGTANTTEPKSGEAQEGNQTAPANEGGDNFTNIDINSLPPELKSKYDNMLSDYKNKTTSIAQERKEIESLRQKADIYDKLSNDDRIVNYINSLYEPDQKVDNRNQVSEQTQTSEEITDEEWQDALSSKEKFMALQRKIIAKENSTVAEKQKKLDSQMRLMKADEFIKNFKSDPRYSNFSKLDDKYKLISYQVAVHKPPPDASEDVWKKTLESAYKNADQVYQDIYREGFQAGLSNRNENQAGMTEPPTGATPLGFEGGDPKKLSAREAVDLARRGIRVPNDW